MNEIGICPICNEPFDKYIRKPTIQECGHGLCVVCCRKRMNDRCVFCRKELNTGLDLVDQTLLDNLAEINRSYKDLMVTDRLRAIASLNSEESSLQQAKNALDEQWEVAADCIMPLEFTLEISGSRSEDPDNLPRATNCSICRGDKLPDTRLYSCFGTSKDCFYFDGGLPLLKNEEKARDKALCDHCALTKKCCLKRGEKHKTIRFWSLLSNTIFQHQLHILMSSYEQSQLDENSPIIIRLREQYRKTVKEEDRRRIFEELEEFVSSTTSLILQTNS